MINYDELYYYLWVVAEIAGEETATIDLACKADTLATSIQGRVSDPSKVSASAIEYVDTLLDR